MSDPYAMATTLTETFAKAADAINHVTAGLSAYERERALFALVSAYSLAEEMWIFKADPANPAFTDWMANGRKTAGDSPYTIYKTAPISPLHVYRLSGNIGKSAYFGVQMYQQLRGFNAPSGVTGTGRIVTDADGNFEVILSAERPANAINWLPLTADDYVLMTREYYYGTPDETPMQLAIERIDDGPAEPQPLVERVAKAAAYFEAIVMSTIEIAGLLSINEFSPPTSEVRMPKYGDSLFPNRDTYYDGFFVRLQPGQAIRMTGRLPDSWIYVSFVFYDRWYATLDYPQTRCYLTGKDLQFNSDGTYTIYLSAEDPGHPNWIQMGALHEGLYSYRYMQADSNPKPTIEIVAIGSER